MGETRKWVMCQGNEADNNKINGKKIINGQRNIQLKNNRNQVRNSFLNAIDLQAGDENSIQV